MIYNNIEEVRRFNYYYGYMRLLIDNCGNIKIKVCRYSFKRSSNINDINKFIKNKLDFNVNNYAEIIIRCTPTDYYSWLYQESDYYKDRRDNEIYKILTKIDKLKNLYKQSL